jgi:hypothetical protein
MAIDEREPRDVDVQQPDEYDGIDWNALPIYVRGAIRGILDDMAFEDATHSPEETDIIRTQVIGDVGYVIELAGPEPLFDKIRPLRLGQEIKNLAEARYLEGNHEVASQLEMLGLVVTAIARPSTSPRKP